MEDDRCVVSVTLIEREGTSAENRVEKTVYFDSDALILDDDVLPVLESALKGFGYVLDGKHLEVVKNER